MSSNKKKKIRKKISKLVKNYSDLEFVTAEKFPGIVKTTPDMVPALIGGLVWMVVMAIIFDKMGTKGIKDGAITGAWLGASKWFFFDMQMLAMIPPIFTMDYMIIDVPLSAFSYAVGGAAIGWALERFE